MHMQGIYHGSLHSVAYGVPVGFMRIVASFQGIFFYPCEGPGGRGSKAVFNFLIVSDRGECQLPGNFFGL